MLATGYLLFLGASIVHVEDLLLLDSVWGCVGGRDKGDSEEGQVKFLHLFSEENSPGYSRPKCHVGLPFLYPKQAD